MDLAAVSHAPLRMLASLGAHPQPTDIQDTHWLGCCIAVLISVTMSGFTVVGLILQKKANKLPSRFTFGDINLSPQWLCGFVVGSIVPIPGTIIAYCLAPMSLTTPLSGISVALNMALAPRLLGEQLQRWPDVCAATSIFIGTVLTTGSGPRQSKEFNASDLEHLLSRDVFIRAVGVLLVVQAAGITYMKCRCRALEVAAAARPANPNMCEVLLPAVVAAGFGSLTNLSLKAFGSLAGTGGNVLQWLLLLMTAGSSGAAQISYLNRGLRLYLQTIFLPVYSAILVLGNTLYGLIFYEEYVYLMREATNCAFFVTGIVFIVCGVALFTLRQPHCPDDDLQCSQEVCLSQGMVTHFAAAEEVEYVLS